MNISVVIPVYNAEDVLNELYRRLKVSLGSVCKNYEILFVEDGGADGSWAVIQALSKDDPRVKGIRLARNFGQHNSLLCGIRAAEYEIILTMDDDLQHPPEEINKLLTKLDEGFDVVYGVYEKTRQGFWRRFSSFATKWVMNRVIKIKLVTQASAFRVFHTSLRDSFAGYRGSFVSIDVLLSWGTCKFGTVSVRHDRRSQGKSHYTFLKLVTHAFTLLTGFSTYPLQLASYLGFFFTLFGFGIFIYAVAGYFLWGDPVPGFPFLASIIAIFSGVQLFVLGIMGEYLARMHSKDMGQPAYVVHTITAESLKESPGRTLRIT